MYLFLGMVYLEPSQLGWEPIYKSWASTQGDDINCTLTSELFNWMLPPMMDFVMRNCKVRLSFEVSTVDVHIL